MWRNVIHLVLHGLWPWHCAACGAPANGPLCAGCRDTVVPTDEGCCPHCGLVDLEAAPGGAHLCGPCLMKPPPWTRARGAFAYGGALRDVISRWKNRPDHTLGPWLADGMTARAGALGWEDAQGPVCVVPVPGHPRRIRARGFHPAGCLARSLARHLDRPLLARGLICTQPAPSSRGLGRRARQRRLTGVFRADPTLLAGAHVLLVDDVMTTGATARAATQACLRGGARRVEVAVLARTPRS